MPARRARLLGEVRPHPQATAGDADKTTLRRWFQRLLNVAGYLLVLACATAAAIPLVGQVTGRWRLLPVLSGSMAPGMVRGDLAWLQPKATSELRVGDVLVYNTPRWGSSRPRRTIHRVVEIVDPSLIRPSDLKPGGLYIRTKGDASADPDPWIAAVTEESVWIRTKTLPNFGRPLLVMGRGGGRVLALVVAGLLIAAFGIDTLARHDPGDSPSDKQHSPLRLPTDSGSEPSFSAAAAAGVTGVLAVAVVGITAAVAAGLTGTEQSQGIIRAGAVVLEIGTSTLNVTVPDLLPGEQVERVLELRNTGSIPLGWVLLQVTGESSPMLDPSDGLQLSIQRCPSSWEAGTGPDGRPSAQCPSQAETLVADRPVLGRTDLNLPSLDADAPGGIDYLRVAIRLPQAADPSSGGPTATVTLAFSAGQREELIR
jgi:signal peptidase I